MSNFTQNSLTDVWKKFSPLASYSAAIQGQWSKVKSYISMEHINIKKFRMTNRNLPRKHDWVSQLNPIIISLPPTPFPQVCY